uniref:Uncharacterized protein n=1 Tax=Wuchereria bancrofti TaxID=6293 RepID=A0A1I8EG53_WUCBA
MHIATSTNKCMVHFDGLSLPISRSREAEERIIYRDCQTAIRWYLCFYDFNSNFFLFFVHISLVIVRAHSTRPMASGYKHMTKDSAFESGENGHPYRRRPSLDYHRSE